MIDPEEAVHLQADAEQPSSKLQHHVQRSVFLVCILFLKYSSTLCVYLANLQGCCELLVQPKQVPLREGGRADEARQNAFRMALRADAPTAAEPACLPLHYV